MHVLWPHYPCMQNVIETQQHVQMSRWVHVNRYRFKGKLFLYLFSSRDGDMPHVSFLFVMCKETREKRRTTDQARRVTLHEPAAYIIIPGNSCRKGWWPAMAFNNRIFCTRWPHLHITNSHCVRIRSGYDDGTGAYFWSYMDIATVALLSNSLALSARIRYLLYIIMLL